MSSYRLKCKKCHQTFDPWKNFSDDFLTTRCQIFHNTIAEELTEREKGLGCFCDHCQLAFSEFVGDKVTNYWKELLQTFIEEESQNAGNSKL